MLLRGIHRAMGGQCFFRVRATMNSSMWPLGRVLRTIWADGLSRYLAASSTCSEVVTPSADTREQVGWASSVVKIKLATQAGELDSPFASLSVSCFAETVSFAARCSTP